MTDLSKTIADWRENGTPGPWEFEESVSPDGQEWLGCGVSSLGKDWEFLWMETHPDTTIPTCRLIAAAPDMAERIEALEAEVARLQALLEAQDAYMAGEPSRPPSSGKSPAALDGESADD